MFSVPIFNSYRKPHISFVSDKKPILTAFQRLAYFLYMYTEYRNGKRHGQRLSGLRWKDWKQKFWSIGLRCIAGYPGICVIDLDLVNRRLVFIDKLYKCGVILYFEAFAKPGTNVDGEWHLIIVVEVSVHVDHVIYVLNRTSEHSRCDYPGVTVSATCGSYVFS